MRHADVQHFGDDQSGTAGGSGATVTLSGAASATTTANSSGAYTFAGLANGTYTVTPSNAGFTFAPCSASATIDGANTVGLNFTATKQAGQTFSHLWNDQSGGSRQRCDREVERSGQCDDHCECFRCIYVRWSGEWRLHSDAEPCGLHVCTGEHERNRQRGECYRCEFCRHGPGVQHFRNDQPGGRRRRRYCEVEWGGERYYDCE